MYAKDKKQTRTENQTNEAPSSKTLFDLLTSPRYLVSATALCAASFMAGIGVGAVEKWREDKPLPTPHGNTLASAPASSTSIDLDSPSNIHLLMENVDSLPSPQTSLEKTAAPLPISPHDGATLASLSIPSTVPRESLSSATVATQDPTLIPSLGVREPSQHGLELIKTFENCELTAYKCASSRWTIGFGHTTTTKKGMNITMTQAEKLLREDIRERVREEAKFFDLVPMTDRQFDAIASGIFNAYCIDKGRSEFAEIARTLIPRLNATTCGAEQLEIAKQLAVPLCKFNKVRGKLNDGLLRRRLSEGLLLAHIEDPIVSLNDYKNAKEGACAYLGIKSVKKRNEEAFVKKMIEIVFDQKCAAQTSPSTTLLAHGSTQSGPPGTPSPSQRPPV